MNSSARTVQTLKGRSNKDDYVFDTFNTFQVLEHSSQPVNEAYRITQICNSLRNNLLHQEVKDNKNIRRLSRQAKYFPIPTDIQFQHDPLHNQTVMQLTTTDRSGLLAEIGQVFSKHQIKLHNTKITTIGSKVEDMFYITDLNLRPISDLNKQEQLHEELKYVLDNDKL